MRAALARCLVVLFVAANTGCGSSPNTSHESITPSQPAAAKAPYRLPAGTRVALAAGQRNLKISYVSALNMTHGSVERGSYTAEFSKGIPEGIAACTVQGYLVALPLCAVGMPIMALLFGLTADATATVKEVANKVSEQDTEEPKSAGELAKEKAVVEELAAMQEMIAKEVTATNATLDPRRSLEIRVQSYARESGVGNFLVLTNTGPHSKSERPGYESQVDYVFDIAITRIELRPGVTTGPGVYAVEFTGAGRLIRMQDNVVVDEFTSTGSRMVPLTPPTTTNATIASERLDAALQTLAEVFVDQWIKPTVKGTY